MNFDIFRMFRQTFLVLRSNTGTCLDEEVHTGGSRALDGPHEGRASAERSTLYGGPRLHQKLNKFHVASLGRVVEGRPEELVTHVYICPVGKHSRVGFTDLYLN